MKDAIHLPAVRAYLLALQARIVSELEAFDGNVFLTDAWQKRPAPNVNPSAASVTGAPSLAGEGLGRIIEEGAFFERGGCNFSHVSGAALPASATAGRAHLVGRPFEALGVSMVLHPRNPYCPTTHMNVRLFVAKPRPGVVEAPVFWFGGGMDLTPFYGFEEDAMHFHGVCARALEPFGGNLYSGFKLWCDEYFFLPHRNEQRGIGGVFFDDFAEFGFDESFAMTRAVGDAFLAAYLPIITRRRGDAYGKRERDFQSYRRGRYAEFNLVLDRGTTFGLKSGGRTESILMSLPPQASWRYDWAPEPGTPEARLYTDFLVPRDWLDAGRATAALHSLHSHKCRGISGTMPTKRQD